MQSQLAAQIAVSELSSHYDVLVVGAGAAGLYTSLCLPSHLKVGLITKDSPSLSASDWAQGGIAAVIAPEDSTALHLKDTLRAGAGLCDYRPVKFLVEHASECIGSLVKMGVAFDRHNGDLALTLEAAHSRRRVLHAADTTGRAVVATLTAQVLKRKNIQVISQAFTLDLWLDSNKRCQGVCLLYQEEILWVRAGAVVLATGGGGQVFAQTTNPSLSTGDGVAIANRAGAILRDLEFIQFHPTALTKSGAPRFLISEAVRGEGAHLVDDQGKRFAFDYHPAGELAPRDVVSRAIFSYLQKTKSDPASSHVWLDLRPIPPETIQYRFPNIVEVCQRWGVDVFHEPIPVAPAAHYWMGGIGTDLLNQTSISGLYAVGETASTGVHGANRLASNSLLECIVFGAQFAYLNVGVEEGGELSKDTGAQNRKNEEISQPTVTNQQVTIDSLTEDEINTIGFLRHQIPRLVWQSAGICREGLAMEGAIAQIQEWQQKLSVLPISQFLLNLQPEQSIHLSSADVEQTLRTWAETRNLLEIGSLILKSAHFRTESRGGHYRLDYPDTDPQWQVHTLAQADRWWKSPIQEELRDIEFTDEG